MISVKRKSSRDDRSKMSGMASEQRSGGVTGAGDRPRSSCETAAPAPGPNSPSSPGWRAPRSSRAARRAPEPAWVVPDRGARSPPAAVPPLAFAFNAKARRRARRRPRRHPRAAGRHRPRRRTVLAERAADSHRRRARGGPRWLVGASRSMLAETGRTAARCAGVGVGLPGPVEHSTGRPVNPPIMPGWDGFPVPAWLGASARRAGPGRQRREHHGPRRARGRLAARSTTCSSSRSPPASARHHHRRPAAPGRAGRGRGHRPHPRARGPRRRLPLRQHRLPGGGGGRAARWRRALRAEGIEAAAAADVVALVRAGDTRAAQPSAQAGREIGEVLAAFVNLLQPVGHRLGGDIAEAGRAPAGGRPRGRLQQVAAAGHPAPDDPRRTLGDRAGVIGAAVMVVEHILAPDSIDQAVTVDPAAVG